MAISPRSFPTEYLSDGLPTQIPDQAETSAKQAGPNEFDYARRAVSLDQSKGEGCAMLGTDRRGIVAVAVVAAVGIVVAAVAGWGFFFAQLAGDPAKQVATTSTKAAGAAQKAAITIPLKASCPSRSSSEDPPTQRAQGSIEAPADVRWGEGAKIAVNAAPMPINNVAHLRYLVVSSHDAVRVRSSDERDILLGVFPSGAALPRCAAFRQSLFRILVPLSGGKAETVSLTYRFFAGASQSVEAHVVDIDENGRIVAALRLGGATIRIAEAEPRIVIAEAVRADQTPQRQYDLSRYGLRVDAYKDEFRVVSADSGETVFGRKGRLIFVSPTQRFLGFAGHELSKPYAENLTLLDVLSGETWTEEYVVHRYTSEMNDGFVRLDQITWGGTAYLSPYLDCVSDDVGRDQATEWCNRMSGAPGARASSGEDFDMAIAEDRSSVLVGFAAKDVFEIHATSDDEDDTKAPAGIAVAVGRGSIWSYHLGGNVNTPSAPGILTGGLAARPGVRPTAAQRSADAGRGARPRSTSGGAVPTGDVLTERVRARLGALNALELIVEQPREDRTGSVRCSPRERDQAFLQAARGREGEVRHYVTDRAFGEFLAGGVFRTGATALELDHIKFSNGNGAPASAVTYYFMRHRGACRFLGQLSVGSWLNANSGEAEPHYLKYIALSEGRLLIQHPIDPEAYVVDPAAGTFTRVQLNRGEEGDQLFGLRDAKSFVQLSSDGRMTFFGVTGKRIAEGAYVDDEIAIRIASGAYDATLEGAQHMRLYFPASRQHVPLADIVGWKPQPEAVRQALLAGEVASAPMRPATPPIVELKATAANGHVLASVTHRGGEAASGAVFAINGRSLRPVQLVGGAAETSLPVSPGGAWVSAFATSASGQRGPVVTTFVKLPGLPQSRLRAVLIGVDRYPGIPDGDLQGGVADARAFSQELAAIGSMTFKSVDAMVLSDVGATRTSILEAIRIAAAQTGSDDQLVLFFGGHGLMYDGKYYLAGHDLDVNAIARTGIAWAEVEAALLSSAGTVVLFLDACHSGAANLAASNEAAFDSSVGVQRSIVLFAASKARELSYEASGESRGVFSLAITRALRDRTQTDVDGNGRIEHIELYRAVRRQVYQASAGRQTPWMATRNLAGEVSIF